MDPKSCLPWMFHPSFFMFWIRDPRALCWNLVEKAESPLFRCFKGPHKLMSVFFVGSNNKNLPDFLEYELFFIFRLCSFICVLGDFPKIFPKIPKVRKLGCLVIPGTFSCLECAGNGTSTLPKSWKVQRTQELECWKDLPGGTKEVVVSLRFEGSESGKNQHFENCE